MCCRSLLLTGYRTQFVPTSFTAHSMSMLVTIPHWLSCNATNSSSAHHHINYHRCYSILLINRNTCIARKLFNSPLCEQDHSWISTERKSYQSLTLHLYSDWELLHCFNGKSLLLVLCKCRPVIIFQSCLMQQMEKSSEQWHDWQRAAWLKKS